LAIPAASCFDEGQGLWMQKRAFPTRSLSLFLSARNGRVAVLEVFFSLALAGQFSARQRNYTPKPQYKDCSAPRNLLTYRAFQATLGWWSINRPRWPGLHVYGQPHSDWFTFQLAVRDPLLFRGGSQASVHQESHRATAATRSKGGSMEGRFHIFEGILCCYQPLTFIGRSNCRRRNGRGVRCALVRRAAIQLGCLEPQTVTLTLQLPCQVPE